MKFHIYWNASAEPRYFKAVFVICNIGSPNINLSSLIYAPINAVDVSLLSNVMDVSTIYIRKYRATSDPAVFSQRWSATPSKFKAEI